MFLLSKFYLFRVLRVLQSKRHLFQKPTFGRRHGILWINVLFTIYLKGSIQGLAPNFMMKWFFKTFMRGMFPEREKIGPSFVKTQ